jgi:hypothetical protein
MTKVALYWATGSDMGRRIRNPPSAGAESMLADAERKSGVAGARRGPISSARSSAGVEGREMCTALEKRRLFPAVASPVPGESNPGKAKKSDRSAIDASCSNSNTSGGATPSSVRERGQVGSSGVASRVGGLVLWATGGRSYRQSSPLETHLVQREWKEHLVLAKLHGRQDF